jgi:hypothetical protein
MIQIPHYINVQKGNQNIEIHKSSLDPHENVNIHQHIQDLLKQQ